MEKPWIDGSKELLNHAAEHLVNKSDFDRRIAFISIDNAVEVMVKTYLSLPSRIRGDRKGPSKKELQEAENSFPTILILLEKYGANKLTGFSLEDIEWYHRLRNQLYHSGNGITVELAKVEAYFEIASALFESLFEEKLILKNSLNYVTRVGLFLDKWNQFERHLRLKLPEKKDLAYYWKTEYLKNKGESMRIIYDEILRFRNGLVYDLIKPSESEIIEIIKKIEYLNENIR